MDREILLAHLRKTHFGPGERERARSDGMKIAGYLKSAFGARVIGIGSAFREVGQFRRTSDIDLVVEGLPPERFYAVSAKAADMTDFPLDLIPRESATPELEAVIEAEGVEL